MTLKSVDDHNRDRRRERREREARLRRSGVACPKCGAELEWESFHETVMPAATTGTARCRACRISVSLER